MTNQQLKQATIEIRNQLEKEIKGSICSLYPRTSSKTAEEFANDYPHAYNELEKALEGNTENQIEALTKELSYTWFNRLCAFRYMDLLHYTPIGVVSGSSNSQLPEMLWETKQGIMPEVYLKSSKSLRLIQDLLNGSTTSSDPDTKMYNVLLKEACHYFNKFMPFLFSSQHSLTDHIVPANLLDSHSVLTKVQELLTEETVLHSLQDTNETHTPANGIVEIVGWLYQYYQTEDHDAIYAAFKNNYKAMAYDLPAATQLYTPEWIVRYMVDNSLGRLWLQNKPQSLIKEKLQYYIEPEEQEEEILKITSPEEITFCDPACGSGHILTYAFEVLFSIYEEEGYTVSEIPKYILKNNLWGMDIDKRACQLASFALVMKARAKDKRFFTREVTLSIKSNTQPIVDCPHICNLHCIRFTQYELEEALKDWQEECKGTLISDLLSVVQLSGVGSLLKPKSSLDEIESLHGYLVSLTNNNSISLNLQVLLPKLFEAVSALLYLSKKYCIVCTNPPYLSTGKLNYRIKRFITDEYKDGKSDLCTSFIIRNFDYLLPKGYNAMVTMESWMFLSSFEILRKRIVDEKTILCLVQMTNGVMRIAFGTSAFVLKNHCNPKYKANYSFVELKDIRKPNNEENVPFEHPYTFPIPNKRLTIVATNDFNKIPGNPISYWVSNRIRQIFYECEPLSKVFTAREGMATANNDKFLKLWHEVSIAHVEFDCPNTETSLHSKKVWFPYIKGGEFRKWFGNLEYLVNWKNDGYEIKNYKDISTGRIRSHNYNDTYSFKEGLTWSSVSSGNISVRYSPVGFLFDSTGPKGICVDFNYTLFSLFLLNTNFSKYILSVISSTRHFLVGDVSSVPNLIINKSNHVELVSKKLISIAKSDWDAYERSWNFEIFPLMLPEFKESTIEESYNSLHNHWHKITCEMQELEEKNNKLFNEAYELEDEISSEVPLKEITLTCNPVYRYPDTRSSDRSIEEKEELLHEDTMKELLSYYVGCLFGRYSLDKPGLVLANQGDTLAEYMAQVELPSFIPDENNVVPILDDYWFNDDIVSRFHSFIKTCFGEEKLDTNFQYIEKVLGKTIRQYFLKDFYKEHVTTYKKRPIYWLFSSPKGSFQVLIYMHRYTKDTPSIILRYLRDYISKLRNRIQTLEAREIYSSLSSKEQNKARKDGEKITKTLKELETYEKEILYPLAMQRIEIDLDDGVKHNYSLFGKALKKISGLS